MDKKIYDIEMHVCGGMTVTVAGKDLPPTAELMQSAIDEGDIVIGLRPASPVYTTVNGVLEILGEAIDIDFHDIVMEDHTVSKADASPPQKEMLEDCTDGEPTLSDGQAKVLGRRIAEVLHLEQWRGRYSTSFGPKSETGLGHTVLNIVREFEKSSSGARQKDAGS